MKFGRIGPLLRNLTLKMPLLGTPENLLKITKTGPSGPHEAAIVLCKHAGIWAPVCYRRIAVPAPPIDQLFGPGALEGLPSIKTKVSSLQRPYLAKKNCLAYRLRRGSFPQESATARVRPR